MLNCLQYSENIFVENLFQVLTCGKEEHLLAVILTNPTC